MSTYLITAKYELRLNDGVDIPKGQSFTVPLPSIITPFSPKGKDYVMKIMKNQGFDMEGKEVFLNPPFFDFKEM